VAVHRIKRGLDLPISGIPDPRIGPGPSISRVAVMGDDTPGVRARLSVAEGDVVKRGQLLFEDRKRPGIRYTAPGAGRVQAIFRGARRRLRSVVIQLSESEQAGEPSENELQSFESFRSGDLDSDALRALLVESGLWNALRTRPFSKVPLPDSKPAALFVTAMDTNPLAPNVPRIWHEAREDFDRGLRALATLCEGTTYLCVAEHSEVGRGVDAPVQVEEFAGPHPAGNAGTHIHLVEPASRHRTLWHIGYQDVIAVGRLLANGVLPVERVVSIGGPAVLEPRNVRARLGANLDELTYKGLREEPGTEVRLISGSVLSGKKAVGPEFGYLGRYHSQVSAVIEGDRRRFLGWIEPGFGRYSFLPVMLSRLIPGKQFDMTTDTGGSQRPMMPIGTYERVLPIDTVATYLLRSLVVGDIEQAEALGALELDEEDLALCTFVCPGKTEFGPYLRQNLERIEKEG
jgi:Na+-transporting NADH:ubiquinone oxidoreductase subunit A